MALPPGMELARWRRAAVGSMALGLSLVLHVCTPSLVQLDTQWAQRPYPREPLQEGEVCAHTVQ